MAEGQVSLVRKPVRLSIGFKLPCFIVAHVVSDLGDTDVGDLSYLEQTMVQMGAKHFKCCKILVTLVRRAAEVPRTVPYETGHLCRLSKALFKCEELAYPLQHELEGRAPRCVFPCGLGLHGPVSAGLQPLVVVQNSGKIDRLIL